ncbi:hypothetical protein [Maricaulis sp.]|uniref:hypothetical protein n=1 Tax=unclassified Maricaulis TaxID=2632371 RepID=UPI001B21F1D8|nr:hypothetical protein [Maricaulis sp.]MBO6796243.1 hypothetical protein [Maricaulis sp.]
MYLPMTPTIIMLVLGVGLFLLARWRGNLPAQPEKGPRMIPWTIVALGSGVLVLFMLANVAAHMGIDLSQMRR